MHLTISQYTPYIDYRLVLKITVQTTIGYCTVYWLNDARALVRCQLKEIHRICCCFFDFCLINICHQFWLLHFGAVKNPSAEQHTNHNKVHSNTLLETSMCNVHTRNQQQATHLFLLFVFFCRYTPRNFIELVWFCFCFWFDHAYTLRTVLFWNFYRHWIFVCVCVLFFSFFYTDFTRAVWNLKLSVYNLHKLIECETLCNIQTQWRKSLTITMWWVSAHHWFSFFWFLLELRWDEFVFGCWVFFVVQMEEAMYKNPKFEGILHFRMGFVREVRNRVDLLTVKWLKSKSLNLKFMICVTQPLDHSVLMQRFY